MNTIEIFDPALCCSTGVCGPTPDSQLATFAATLECLKKAGVNVARHNLAQEPLAFAQNAEVKAILQKDSDSALPLTFINGQLHFRSVYPSQDQLAQILGIDLNSETCCQPKQEKKPIAYQKVETAKTTCCDPSTGCC